GTGAHRCRVGHAHGRGRSGGGAGLVRSLGHAVPDHLIAAGRDRILPVQRDRQGRRGGKHSVVTANIKDATLENLCQSAVTETPVGKVGVLIKAGGEGEPASAKDLKIGMTGLKGDAEFENIRIGVDASDVNTKSKGSKGDFAQDSDTISIKDLEQD